MPRLSVVLLVVLAIPTSSLYAGPIVGSQVTGSLQFGVPAGVNVFDPANGEVPNGFLNKAGTTVTISATQPEFGYKNPFSFSIPFNLFSIDFTETQLTITDQINGSANRFTMTFTSDAFLGATLTESSDTFTGGGLNATLLDTTITITWLGTQGTPQFLKTLKGVFTLTPGETSSPSPPASPSPPTSADPTAAPEPTSIAIFAVVGAASIVAWRRRRGKLPSTVINASRIT